MDELCVITSEAHVRAVARAYGLTPERHDFEIELRVWLEPIGEYLTYRAALRERDENEIGSRRALRDVAVPAHHESLVVA